MLKLIKAEIFKQRKRSMTLVLGIILLAVVFLMMLLMQAAIKSGNGNALPGDISLLKEMIPLTLTIIAQLGTLLAVILVAGSIGSEYSWHTIRPYLLCSESRVKMFTAKLITAAISILAGMVIAVIATIFLGMLFTAIRGFSWDMSFFDLTFISNQLLTFIRTFYVILPYTLLAFLFTVIGRSTAAGIGLGIGVFFLEPPIAVLMSINTGWISKIPDYLLHNNIQAINVLAESSLKIDIGQAGHLPGILHAFIILTGYCAAFIAIAFTLFRKRDVTG